MSAESFSVRIFLQDGTVDGVKIVARSKWSGRALVIPRSSLAAEISRDELSAPGFYILIGPPDHQDRVTLHIGAADPLSADLKEHSDNTGFWTWMIVCSSKHDSLTPAHTEHIKARLIQLAKESGKASLDNPGSPDQPRLDDAAVEYAEDFLGHALSIYPVLGLRVFE